MRRHVVGCLPEDVGPAASALAYDVACEVEVPAVACNLIEPHHRFKQARRLYAVVAPALLRDVCLRRVAHLTENAVGLVRHGLQHGGVAVNMPVVLRHGQQHVFAFPEVAAAAAGLLFDRRARDGAVASHRREEVFHGGLQDAPELRVAGVAVVHRSTAHGLTPHLTHGELRAPLAEELDKSLVRQHALVPMQLVVENVVLEEVGQADAAVGQGTDDILYCLARWLGDGTQGQQSCGEEDKFDACHRLYGLMLVAGCKYNGYTLYTQTFWQKIEKKSQNLRLVALSHSRCRSEGVSKQKKFRSPDFSNSDTSSSPGRNHV